MKKKIAVLFVALTLCLSGCGLFNYENNTETEPLSTPMKVEYTMYKVIKGDIINSFSSTCLVTSYSAVKHRFSGVASGVPFDKFYVHTGDKVKAGDVLCSLNVEKEKRLLEEGNLSDEERASLKAIVDNAELKAECDGIVRFVNNDFILAKAADKTVDESVTMVVVDPEDIGTARAVLTIDGERAEKFNIDINSEVVLKQQSGDKTEFKATVVGSSRNANDDNETEAPEETENSEDRDEDSEKGDRGNQGNRKYYTGSFGFEDREEENKSIILEIELSNAPDTVKVGDRLSLTYVESEIHDCLKIPVEALYSFEGRNFVYVLDSQGLRREKPIDVGIVTDTVAEVISGLSDGDLIIEY